MITTDHIATPLPAPAAPAIYEGIQQYEAENMDYKGSTITVSNKPGTNALTGCCAQGYLSVIPRTDALLRDTLHIPHAGTYTLALRYTSTATPTAVPFALHINNEVVNLPTAAKTNDWQEIETDVVLEQGENVLQLGFNLNWGSSNVHLDCIRIHPKKTSTSVENTIVTPDETNTPSMRYNVLGMPVSDNYKGFVIERNKKYIKR